MLELSLQCFSCMLGFSFLPAAHSELWTGHSVCYVWFLVSVSICCLEKEDETLARGGIEVILKTGYQDGKCWIDKACRESSEYTEAGNRLLVLLMQRRWKTARAWICRMHLRSKDSIVSRCLLIAISKSGLIFIVQVVKDKQLSLLSCGWFQD